MLVCWLGLPLALGLLSLGCGLMLDRLAGSGLHGALLAPAGLAVVVVVAQGATASDATAALAVPALLLLAAAGLVAGHSRLRDVDRWAAAAAAGAYAAFALPTVASGDATFAGYVKLDDTATWLAIADRVLAHGRDLGGLEPSTYEATLEAYVGHGYPVGSFLPLAVAHSLLGEDSAWLFQPALAFFAAMLALVLYALAAPALRSRPARAAVAFVAAQPALLFAYSLWGGVKEMAGAWLVALVAALLVPALRCARLMDVPRVLPVARRLIPAAMAAAALLAVGSLAAGLWLAVPATVAVVTLLRVTGVRRALATGALVATLTLALSLPTLLVAHTFLSPGGRETLTSSRELGNLAGSLSPFQALGIWPNGDFRFDPEQLEMTVALVVVLVLAALAGLVLLLRRRSFGAVVFAASVLAGCGLIAVLGSPWVDAKAYAIASPAAVLLAMLAAAMLWGERRRAAALLIGLPVAGGVLWSNALAYENVNLAPRDRMAELERIGGRTAGEGPTLMTEYEPYGVRHFLRRGDPEGVSEFRRRTIPLRGGRVLDKLEVADVDEIDQRALLVYRTLVLRRSPLASRPPSVYRPTWRGRYYEVWQRGELSEAPELEHLPLGGKADPATVPRCGEVLRMARRAGPGGLVASVVRPPPAVLRLTRTRIPPRWETYPGGELSPVADGTIEAKMSVAGAGRYGAWVGGAFRRRVALTIDGEATASRRHELSHAGQFQPLGTAVLAAGPHRVRLEYGDAGAHPGNRGEPFPLGPLVLSRTTAITPVTYIEPARARELCGRPLDWIEAVRSLRTP